jgi:hypothetical protein
MRFEDFTAVENSVPPSSALKMATVYFFDTSTSSDEYTRHQSPEQHHQLIYVPVLVSPLDIFKIKLRE